MTKSFINVALIGNPNTGKTSLFNELTGLNQKVGNYPGVTVDKKQGTCKLSETTSAIITDLPGTYSINPTSIDESIVLKTLLDDNIDVTPDVVLIVTEVENLKRNLLLFSQIKDLGKPTILAINMEDQMKKKGISIDVELLKKELNTEIVLVSARKKSGIEELKNTILNLNNSKEDKSINDLLYKIDSEFFKRLEKISNNFSLYQLWLMLTQNNYPEKISEKERLELLDFKNNSSNIKKYQHKETIYLSLIHI